MYGDHDYEWVYGRMVRQVYGARESRASKKNEGHLNQQVARSSSVDLMLKVRFSFFRITLIINKRTILLSFVACLGWALLGVILFLRAHVKSSVLLFF